MDGFPVPARLPDRIRAEIHRLARRVAEDLAEDGRPAVRVVVKVRFAPFFTYTQGANLPVPSQEPGDFQRAALEALERLDLGRPVPLLGVRAELPR